MLDLDALYGFHEELAGGVRSPRVNAALTYLAEIECYHPYDDSATNLLLNTEDFTVGEIWQAWKPDYDALDLTVVANAINDPNGNLTADLVTPGGTLGIHQAVTVTPETDYVFSCYVKLEAALFGRVRVYDVSHQEDIGAVDGGDAVSWTRLELAFTTPAGCHEIYVVPGGGGGTYLWGAQLETGTAATAYTPVLSLPTRTLRFASLPYTSQIDDAPAQTHYESRLIQPGLMRRDLFSPGQPGGQISVGYGLVEILNTGDLDEYTAASFDGRSYVLKFGRIDQPLREFTTILKTTMAAADFTTNRMTIKLRDRLAELDKPVTALKYRGDGSELEGDADLKDRYKPLIFGDVKYITPVLTHEAKAIYQVSSNPIDTTGIVLYEGGAAVTRGTDYTSAADMIANSPASGQYRVWPEGGFLRLGFTPNFQLSARIYADDDTRNVGEAFKQLALAAGWPASDINAADVTALTGDAVGTVNLFIENGGQALELMNRLAQGRGIWFGPDRLGVLRMGTLKAPSGTPELSLTATEIVRLERQGTETLPAKQLTLKRDKNWTVHTEFTTGISSVTRQWLSNEWRQTIAIDTQNAAARKLAPVLEIESLINANEADTATQAYRMLALYATPRDILNVTIRARVEDTLLLDLNDVVQVTYPRFGLDSGKLFRVIGIQADYRIGQLELTLWG